MSNKVKKILLNYRVVFFIGLFVLLVIFTGFVSQQKSDNPTGFSIGAVIHENDNKMYVLNTNGFVTTVDLDSNTVAGKFYVGDNPSYIGINSNINKLYISSRKDNTVTIIDIIKKSTKIIFVGTSPRKMYINTVNNNVYVLNYNSNDISVLDGLNDNVISTISVDGKPIAIDILKSLNIIYITTLKNNSVIIIDGGEEEIISSISLGSKPRFVFVAQSGSGLYIADGSNNNMFVANVLTGEIKNKYDIVGMANSAILIEGEEILYVGNNLKDSSNFLKINVRDKTSDVINIKGSIPKILYKLEDKKLYVFNSVYPEVSIIDELNFKQEKVISLPRIYNTIFLNKISWKIYLLSKSNTIGIIDSTTDEFIEISL